MTVYSENFRTLHPHGELDPRARNGHADPCMVAVPTSPAGYPMAPSAEVWEALSPDQRTAVVAALPGEVTYDEMAMPEGDLHLRAKIGALLLESEEFIVRLQALADDAQRRAEEEARLREQAEQRREEEQRLREDEQQRREEAEQEVARLRAELERLKR